MSEHPVSDHMIDEHFRGFMQAILKRLECGANQYGDASFGRPVDELRGELEQEMLDIAGWAFIMYCRSKASKN